MTERRFAVRVVLVMVAVFAVWTALGARLAFLHLGPHEDLRARVQGIRHLEHKILGQRGRILDRKGNILALDLAVKNVCANPDRIIRNGQLARVTSYLSHILDLPPATVFSRLNHPGDPFEYVQRYVHTDLADRIAKMQLKGVSFRDDTARSYPLGPMLCHVVGFSNMEGVGSAGVEQRMDQSLRGHEGILVSEHDGRGREVYGRRDLEIDPQPGADVYLTIDEKLQYFVEKGLDDVMTDPEQTAKACWAIIEDVRTGEILAMASRPNYDLNDYRHAGPDQLRNRAVADVYEPGSTMKGPVLSAALNERVVSPSDRIDCEMGRWFYGGRSLRDYHGHGVLTVANVLKKSSNIGMAKIALKLGDQRVDRYLRDFGFGSRSGYDLPGEERGIFQGVDTWSKIRITRLAMGHGIAATALQVLNAYCCIANHGFRMKPYVVQKVVDADGKVLLNREPSVLSRPIRQETADLMCNLLSRVTEDGGTAPRAAVKGYRVAGKTGTAQKPIPGGYSDKANIASFVGFLPADDPAIGIIVVVDEPQPRHTGGTVAAPVFRDIAEQAVRYLDIPPDRARTIHLTQAF